MKDDGTVVELHCKPVDSVGSGTFELKDDGGTETLLTYYTGGIALTDRINRITGTLQHGSGSERWLEVDDGPEHDPQGYTGMVQTAAQGTIAWTKTFPDMPEWEFLPAALNDKVVSRVYPGEEYLYIQEQNSSSGIRVNDGYAAFTLQPGQLVSIPEWSAQVTTLDGERVIIPWYGLTTGALIAPPKPVGVSNRDLGGGEFNMYTHGPAGGAGLNDVGLLVRCWGKVTFAESDSFWLDDGSGLSDGPGHTGVRVQYVEGYLPYADDYVAVNGICGLETVSSGVQRVLRVARSADLTPVTPARPVGLEAYATGADKIAVYWPATPGATGYNIYRGTTSGGPYAGPLNGGTPITTPTFTGGTVFGFTDTGTDIGGLVAYTEYFYVVKALSPVGLSEASDEASAIPYPEAIPWDSNDVYAITEAVRIRTGVPYGDYELNIRVCGPDGRIYSTGQSQPLPPDGTLIEGTYLLQTPWDEIIPLPADSRRASGGTPPALRRSDGPYRRVKSYYAGGNLYIGSFGYFYLPDGNSIRLNRSAVNRDTPYIYLGHHIEPAGIFQPKTDVDAGMMYRPLGSWGNWAPFMWASIGGRRLDNPRYLANIGLGIKYLAGSEVDMMYVTDYDHTYLVVHGWNDWFTESISILSNAYAASVMGGEMKRAHSIAQGEPDHYRLTGSYILGEYCYAMHLLRLNPDLTVSPVLWTSDLTSESGSYPVKGQGGIIDWNETNPYYAESEIDIDL